MSKRQRILVVDGLPETETVLKAVLEPKGHSVLRTQSRHLPRFEKSTEPPQVVVFHADEVPTPGSADELTHRWHDVPKVVIGSATIPSRAMPENQPQASYLSHPFQYGELLSVIEHLLASESSDDAAEWNRAA